MGPLLTQFVGLSAVIVLAGILLTYFADRVADALGIGATLGGLVLLALATSLPELTIGWTAVQLGALDLTVGELLGSSLINILILAIIDLCVRSKTPILSHNSASHALAATTSLLLTGLVLFGLVTPLPQVIGRMGPVSIAILISYVLCLRLVYFDMNAGSVLGQADNETSVSLGRRVIDFGGYIAAAAVIFFAAPPLASSADQLAELTGLGETFFGAVFVGAVTSLPEMVTTAAAVRMGSVDMAVGNVFGSNAFNMAIMATVDLAEPDSLLRLVSPVHAASAAAVVLVTCAAIMGLLYRAKRKYVLIEADAALLIAMIVASFWMIHTITR